MNPYSLQDFINLFQDPNFDEFYDNGVDYVISEAVEITNAIYNNKQIVVLNRLVFEQDVIFDEVDINISLVFKKCQFKKSLIFKGIHSAGMAEGHNSDLFGLHFDNCTFDEMVHFVERCRIDRDISFKSNCELRDGVSFEVLTVNGGSVVFDKSTVNRIIDVNNCQLSDLGFTIHDCLIKGQIRITAGVSGSISFLKSKFEKDISVWATTLKHLIFNYGVFEDEVRLQAVAGNPRLTVFSGSYHDKVIVEYEDKTNKLSQGFKELFFESCEFNNGMEVYGLQNPFGDMPTIDFIQIKSSTRLKGDLAFNDLNLGSFNLFGINQNATIKLNSIFVNRLWIDNFSNYSKIIFNKVRPSYTDWFREIKNGDKVIQDKIGSLIKLEHSDLGYTKFWGFDFKSFESISFNNVILSSCEFHNVTWFDHEKLGIYKNAAIKASLKGTSKTAIIGIISDFKNRREIYRQLKQAMYSQGDTIQALKFKSLEMEQYHEQVKLQKPITELKSLHEVGDRFSIFLNRFSNSNGLDWTRPVGLILLGTLIAYTILTIQSNNSLNWVPATSCLEIKHTLSVLWGNVAVYFRLMDPTSRLNEVLGYPKEANPGRVSGVVYFLYKIFLAYLIFQTIAAFRKYLK